MDFLRELAASHRRLKKKIHSTRIPLGPAGRVGMGLFYLVSPVVAGYYIMQWTNRISERNLGIRLPKHGSAATSRADGHGGDEGEEDEEELTPKLQQTDRVRNYVAMQKAELGSLLRDIEAGRDVGDWRRDGPPAPRGAGGGGNADAPVATTEA